MRVLIITDTFPPEKVGSYRMYDLAVNFSKDGFGVTVLCPPPTFPFGSFKRTWKPAKIHFLNGFKVVNLWTWQPKATGVSKLSRIAYYSIMPLLAAIWTILRNDFDVIITSSGTTPFIWLPGLLAKRLFRKKWIIDERDLLIDGAISLGFLARDSMLTMVLKKFEAKCYQESDAITVPARGVKGDLLSYGIHEDKVVLIPNAAETDVFYPQPAVKKRQIIYAGNIGYAYDFDCLISAMKLIRNHNVRLLIVGEGDVKHNVQNAVSSNNLNDHIILLDGLERNQLPHLLSESIAGVAPLRKLDVIEEAIPAKIFDYMACGIPFVAFGGSDLRQIAEDSNSGFVVENNPDVLAKTILIFVENPELARQMGQNGQEYCKKFYSRKKMAEKAKTLIYHLNEMNEQNCCTHIN
jgi:colanic acid biosynthesis glycosyl transferase WcaI